jgi:hypothetical protein
LRRGLRRGLRVRERKKNGERGVGHEICREICRKICRKICREICRKICRKIPRGSSKQEPNASAKLSPNVIRIAPKERKTVKMVARLGVKSFELRYAVSLSSTAFKTHTGRYRAYSDGETVMCVPIASALHTAMQARAESIIKESKELVTDKDMPTGTYIYTPGPAYRAAGAFCRDFLYQLEGSGRDIVTADEVKRAVDYHALKQLTANTKVGSYTYPKGAIPDHVYPDGRYCWGPGMFYGDNTAHFRCSSDRGPVAASGAERPPRANRRSRQSGRCWFP